MFRMRRYRVFIAFAVITVLAFYHFSGDSNWTPASDLGAGSLRQAGIPHVDDHSPPPAQPGPGSENVKEKEQKTPEYGSPQEQAYDAPQAAHTPAVGPPAPVMEALPNPPLPQTVAPVAGKEPASAPTPDAFENSEPAVTPAPPTIPLPYGSEDEDVPAATPIAPPSSTVIHWSKQPEHFPVSSTIQLPVGSPKAIPRIQHTFTAESAENKAARLEKLAIIKDAAIHAWDGYKTNAWMHDEVKPVSGGFKDPFCGWAATLVDGLDTLWIMGLRAEFEEAVRAVGTIDFTTSPRKDIPLFETTIRYLGGLLSAYDLSGGAYVTLLDKAVELAEVLMGAFDTPNRMPVTYYLWKPAFASQPHRAGTHVVMAEIGSLSMEFTRLAQLTKEPKYYDAIDRITDAFYEWQEDTENGSLVPGLFSTYVDASGCEKPGKLKHKEPTLSPEHAPVVAFDGPVDGEAVIAGEPIRFDKDLRETPETKQAPAGHEYNSEAASDASGHESTAAKQDRYDGSYGAGSSRGSIQKRQLEGELADSRQETNAEQAQSPDSLSQQQTVPKKPIPSDICIPRGLASSTRGSAESFTLGGMADSTYEYFPKQYLLLGGLEPKYQTMHERAMDAAIEKLIFRPMTPDNQDILFSGVWTEFSRTNEEGKRGRLKPEAAHLTCFAGAMFALGGKIFGREADVDIGSRLTEGCVWAYNVTATGIMPEQAFLTACDSVSDCAWNETAYWEALDPYHKTREDSYAAQLLQASRRKHVPRPTAVDSDPQSQAQTDTAPRQRLGTAKHVLDNSILTKRQHSHSPGQTWPKVQGQEDQTQEQEYRHQEQSETIQGQADTYEGQAESDSDTVPTKASVHPDGTMSEPVVPPPISHEEFVQQLIQQERLPPGFTSIASRHYILRPEAIESVFYMYRISGDPHWREVGWNMFRSIQAATKAPYGHSAIRDVTDPASDYEDSEESFWIAETLKYFFLLFSEESVLSLDEWVLNTEAHPFRRPDAPVQKAA